MTFQSPNMYTLHTFMNLCIYELCKMNIRLNQMHELKLNRFGECWMHKLQHDIDSSRNHDHIHNFMASNIKDNWIFRVNRIESLNPSADASEYVAGVHRKNRWTEPRTKCKQQTHMSRCMKFHCRMLCLLAWAMMVCRRCWKRFFFLSFFLSWFGGKFKNCRCNFKY